MITHQVTLKQMRYFEALARHAHFGRAAAACTISQPALSMQIKELEETLGSPLIERGSRTLRLTPFGEEAVLRIRSILRAVNELTEAARVSQGRIAGRLRLGMIPTVAPYLLPRTIEALAQKHPHVDVRVREAVTSRLIDELAEGRLDAAIVALPVSEPSLTEVALFKESFVLVRPRQDEGKPAPDARMLHDMRLLLLEEGHCFRNQALSFCGLKDSPPREALDASSLSTLVQMVKAGMGVTLIPEMAVAVEAGSASVSITRFKGRQPSRTIGMIWRKTSPMAAQLLQLSDVMGQVAGPERPRSKVRRRLART